MKWFLDIVIPYPPRRVHHRDAILLMGSCFTENIGKSLNELKFDTTYNPTGILFDPHSVCRHLDDFVKQRNYTSGDLVRHHDVYHSWNHHGKFSNTDADKVTASINASVKVGSDALRRARWCVLTLGSSFAYRLEEKNERVANCHKIPQTAFVKEMMTSDETFVCLQKAMREARGINPKLEFILTVSPVRHSRDGLVENNRSKARLLEAVHRLVEAHDFVNYFPAYELVIDVLRDYRFYDVDLVHPNYAATQFVFEKFCETWLDAETNGLVEDIKPIVTAYRHKPLHPDTDAHNQFLHRMTDKVNALSRQTPWCDWTAELAYFSNRRQP